MGLWYEYYDNNFNIVKKINISNVDSRDPKNNFCTVIGTELRAHPNSGRFFGKKPLGQTFLDVKFIKIIVV